VTPGIGRASIVQEDAMTETIAGDAHSIEQATARVAEAGLAGHECRDIDLVTRNVLDALEPGGWFVLSDFPFPDTDEGLRSVPGRIMGGIQFFEAQIDDQLLPRAYYDGLLTRHQFTDLGSASLTPMDALTWGRRPVSSGCGQRRACLLPVRYAPLRGPNRAPVR
jgi:hypothetical protein